jgi:hypothetical protein
MFTRNTRRASRLTSDPTRACRPNAEQTASFPRPSNNPAVASGFFTHGVHYVYDLIA